MKTVLFRSFFPHVLGIAQPDFTRKETTADGTIRILSRIDRASITLPVAEERGYLGYSHVATNLGERSIPSDHVSVRVVVQKPTIRCDQVKRIPSWMPKHHVFCSILKKICDDHQYPADPFAALADFKAILEKARKQTHRELPRKNPGSLGAKLLIASTALRAYRNRHQGTLMHCCEAWRPVGKCFDQHSFECVDFHGLSKIIASLTRERIAEREAEIHSLPWTQTEKDNASACRLSLRAWRTKKPMLCLQTATQWRVKTKLTLGYVPIGGRYLRLGSKVTGTIATRPSCGRFKRYWTTFSGRLIDKNLI